MKGRDSHYDELICKDDLHVCKYDLHIWESNQLTDSGRNILLKNWLMPLSEYSPEVNPTN